MTLLLNRWDVQSLLGMRDAIPIVEDGFAAFAKNKSITPQRSIIRIIQSEGVSAFMPAYVPPLSALAIKVVSLFKNNPVRHRLPAFCGVIILIDNHNGDVLSVMDADYITAVRTGAASGVATKYLARRDSQIVGCLGSGKQALTQVWAVCEVSKIDRVKVYSPHIAERIGGFRHQLERVGLTEIRVEATKKAEDAVRGSDIVIMATNASEPVIDGSWLAKGAHVNAIGSHFPAARELDTKSLRRSTVICDSVEACLAEAGDLLIPIQEDKWQADHIYGHLGEIVVGDKDGRTEKDQITLFKSVGLAFQDAVVARYVFDQALRNDVGTQFEFGVQSGASILPRNQ